MEVSGLQLSAAEYLSNEFTSFSSSPNLSSVASIGIILVALKTHLPACGWWKAAGKRRRGGKNVDMPNNQITRVIQSCLFRLDRIDICKCMSCSPEHCIPISLAYIILSMTARLRNARNTYYYRISVRNRGCTWSLGLTTMVVEWFTFVVSIKWQARFLKYNELCTENVNATWIFKGTSSQWVSIASWQHVTFFYLTLTIYRVHHNYCQMTTAEGAGIFIYFRSTLQAINLYVVIACICPVNYATFALADCDNI